MRLRPWPPCWAKGLLRLLRGLHDPGAREIRAASANALCPISRHLLYLSQRKSEIGLASCCLSQSLKTAAFRQWLAICAAGVRKSLAISCVLPCSVRCHGLRLSCRFAQCASASAAAAAARRLSGSQESRASSSASNNQPQRRHEHGGHLLHASEVRPHRTAIV